MCLVNPYPTYWYFLFSKTVWILYPFALFYLMCSLVWKWKCLSLSHVWLFETLWTIAHWLLCPWDSLCKNNGVCCHFHLLGIFFTQGFNLCLPHYGQILCYLNHQESPGITLFSVSFSNYSDSLSSTKPRNSMGLGETENPLFWVHTKYHVHQNSGGKIEWPDKRLDQTYLLVFEGILQKWRLAVVITGTKTLTMAFLGRTH